MLTKLHTNPSKFFWGRPKKKLEGFVWIFPSITGRRSQRQFAPKCSFWQVGLLQIVLSEYPDKSNNFRNFIFMTSSLKYSITRGYKCVDSSFNQKKKVSVRFLFSIPLLSKLSGDTNICNQWKKCNLRILQF